MINEHKVYASTISAACVRATYELWRSFQYSNADAQMFEVLNQATDNLLALYSEAKENK